jgi:hypothetical protein
MSALPKPLRNGSRISRKAGLNCWPLIYIDLRRNALNALFNHLIRAGAAVAGYAGPEAADFPAKLVLGYIGID